MNPPEAEETIFAEALRLPPEERAAYLAQATDGNAALRQRVESLLGSYEAGDFLEQAATPQLRQTLQIAVPPSEKPGDRIGRYKLLEKIEELTLYTVQQAKAIDRKEAEVASLNARLAALEQVVERHGHIARGAGENRQRDAGRADVGKRSRRYQRGPLERDQPEHRGIHRWLSCGKLGAA
jgi:hypothetical protein